MHLARHQNRFLSFFQYSDLKQHKFVSHHIPHLARKVAAINALTPKLSQELADKNQEDLFRKMELPLSIILAEMEISGIKVDATRLQEMEKIFLVFICQFLAQFWC